MKGLITNKNTIYNYNIYNYIIITLYNYTYTLHNTALENSILHVVIKAEAM